MMELQKIISQLEINKTIMRDMVHDISDEQACWKADKDRWSIIEILNHLIDIEIEDFRYNLNLILFTPEKKWPSFNEIEWITSRKYNERKLNSSIENFIKERSRSMDWLNGLLEPDLFSKHIENGIRAGDLLASWKGHDLFHIKQITLLKWDILKTWSDPFTPDYSGFY